LLTLVSLKLFAGRVLSPFAQAGHVDKILVLVSGGLVQLDFLVFLHSSWIVLQAAEGRLELILVSVSLFAHHLATSLLELILSTDLEV